jgi:hypothetical protein
VEKNMNFSNMEKGSGKQPTLAALGPTAPFFEINCQSPDIDCPPGKRLPIGTRLHLMYKAGSVTERSLEKFTGRVLGGMDWLLVRDDGVVVFDGRITVGRSAQDVTINVDIPADEAYKEGRDLLKNSRKTSTSRANGGHSVAAVERGRDALDPREMGFLANVIISGQAHLPDDYRGPASQFSGKLSVALPVLIEAATRVENWSTPRFRELGRSFEPFSVLLRNQCVASGAFTFKAGRVVDVHLEVSALQPISGKSSR